MKSIALLLVGVAGVFLFSILAQESIGDDSGNSVATKTAPAIDLVHAGSNSGMDEQGVWWRQYVRLALLFVLALAALGVSNGIGLSVLGGIAGSVGIWGFGWGWLPSVEGGLALSYCLPLFLTLGSKAPHLLVGAAIVVGVPTLLVSHIVLASNWIYAGADAIVLALLFPPTIHHALAATGVIETPTARTYSGSPSSIVYSSTPDPPRRSEMRS